MAAARRTATLSGRFFHAQQPQEALAQSRGRLAPGEALRRQGDENVGGCGLFLG
jgi:hypothetical protein